MSETNSTRLWDGTPLLPPIGALVLIEHGRDDKDHVCVVTGYEVHGPLRGERNLHRVFVNLVYRGTDTPNQRLLNDVRPLTKARSIAQGDA
ncbi:hypothetical protein X879_1957 [Burkholderia pseudomallei MSHR3951]|uniref:hypothetical protein n=1 Tax=Burkholderia pseudomallei TaxID=28450 RepID=UPI0005391243|nr:hypothetical protein [Burkholderia pseudomallei]KGV87477.1 hypothetical protein X879_1957 [Burkholderia pseudomallei MSHR3951]